MPDAVTPEVVPPEANLIENVYDKSPPQAYGAATNPWLLYIVIAFGLFLLWGDE